MQLIKDLFCNRKIKFTHDTRMKRYFRGGEMVTHPSRQTDRSQEKHSNDAGSSYSKGNTTNTTDLQFNMTNTDETEADDDYDVSISPIKGRERRTGMIREEKFMVPGTGIMQTQARNDKKAVDNKEKQAWKEQIEYFEKIKKVVPVQKTIIDSMKKAVLLGSNQ